MYNFNKRHCIRIYVKIYIILTKGFRRSNLNGDDPSSLQEAVDPEFMANQDGYFNHEDDSNLTVDTLNLEINNDKEKTEKPMSKMSNYDGSKMFHNEFVKTLGNNIHGKLGLDTSQRSKLQKFLTTLDIKGKKRETDDV